MRVIVLSFENLPACSLGCYGEWNIQTPEFDFLASHSYVFENFFMSPATGLLLKQFREDAAELGLVRSDQLDAEEVANFPHQLVISAGEVPEESDFSEFLNELPGTDVFIHFTAGEPTPEELDATAGAWDIAASSVSDDFCDFESEGEALLASIAPVSVQSFASRPAWQQSLIAHSAQVRQCDAAFSVWLELLENVLEEGDVIVVTASSGDVRRLCDDRPEWLKVLSEPLVHLPLMIHRVGDQEQHRIDNFIAVEDLPALIEIVGSETPESTAQWFEKHPRKQIQYESDRVEALRTPEWLTISQKVSQEVPFPTVMLFRKPEDKWEVNDLSRQFPDVSEQLRNARSVSGDCQ
ncbi:hypothetical protein SH668x_002980 [Planctomicrobium sp. SH668]|uniref:hypothetical protein n=1 Tax=Planctomicrobium sp. SH668 TaxID=3448126 RepID=UPI003F5B5DBD